MILELQLPPLKAQSLGKLPLALLVVTDTGLIQFVNTAATDLLQASEEEILGRSWAGLDAHLTLIAWKNAWKRIQKKGFHTYTTDLSIGGALLRPASVSIVPVERKLGLILIEDQIGQEGQEAQLSLLNTQTRIGHFRYDYLAKRWHLSSLVQTFLGYTSEGKEENKSYAEEEIEERLAEVLLPKSWEKLENNFFLALKENKAFEQELLFKDNLPHTRLTVSIKVLANDFHAIQLVGTLGAVSQHQAGGIGGSLAQFSLDHARDMIFWAKADGQLAYANQSFLERLGYTHSEVKKLSILDLVVNKKIIVVDKLWGKLSTRKFSEGEIRVKSKEGKKLDVSYNANFVQEGEEQYACFYVRDITLSNQRKALLELTQFSTDNAPDLIFWTHPDGSTSYVNDIACKKLGYSKEELIDHKVTLIVPYFDDKARFAFWERLRTEKSFQTDFALYAKNGKIIETSVNVNYLNFGGKEIACSFCRDITTMKIRRRRRNLLEFTLDSVQDVVLWLRPNGTVQYANEQFFEKTGYQESELENLETSQIFQLDSMETPEEIWSNLREKGELEKDVSLVFKNGKEKKYRANFNYINYKDAEYNCIYLRDQSKKKKRELELKLAYGALKVAEEVVVWLEEDGTVRYLNKAMINYIGGKKEIWLNKQLRRVFPQLKLSMIKPGTSMEYSMPSHEGHTVYFELTFNEIKQGGKRYLVIIGRNFTERYLRRQEIEKAHQRIAELSNRLQEENIILREEVSGEYSVDNIITVSPNYQKVLHKVSQVAEADTTVLILGETGTGKELLARAVHELSDREEYSLIKVNCAALPENLIESELFGHEQGAFTGAQARKKGRFELANRGTIFLDEVGEMPLALQAKLLRVLQEGEFERVGGTETIKVDVRLIAATNRSLEEMVRAGRFRADLYYRLNVFPIENIPLRERPEDIPVLAQFFAKRFAKRQAKTIGKISATDLKRLQEYRFPGNVRELENIIERAVVLCNGDILKIPLDKDRGSDMGENVFPTFDEMQRNYIIKALKRTEGRITGPEGAGRLLGLNDRTLMSKMRKFNIEKKEYLI